MEGYIRDRRIYVPDHIDPHFVRTNPEQMQNIQERYRVYQGEYRQYQATRPDNLETPQ